MARKTKFCHVVAWAACVGMFLPHSAGATDLGHRGAQGDVPAGVQRVNEITDVALGAEGVFAGQVLHAAGQPAEDIQVLLRQNGREVAVTRTDLHGNFAISGLRGGVVELTAGQSHGLYRLWVAQTAPPSAQRGVLVISERNVVRGQSQHGLLWWATNPWVLATAVSVAIAVPIALTNNQASGS